MYFKEIRQKVSRAMGESIPLQEFKGYFSNGGMKWVGYGDEGVKFAKRCWKANADDEGG